MSAFEREKGREEEEEVMDHELDVFLPDFPLILLRKRRRKWSLCVFVERGKRVDENERVRGRESIVGEK